MAVLLSGSNAFNTHLQYQHQSHTSIGISNTISQRAAKIRPAATVYVPVHQSSLCRLSQAAAMGQESQQQQQQQQSPQIKEEQQSSQIKQPLITDSEADRIFDAVDADGSGTIDVNELTGHLSAQSYTGACIRSLFSTIDIDGDGTISRSEFRTAILDESIFDTGGNNYNDEDADAIFKIADTDNSGSIDLQELSTLLSGGTAVETTIPTTTMSSSTSTTVVNGISYPTREIQKLFSNIDQDGNGEISREEFRRAIAKENWPSGEEAPRGYFLNSVNQVLQPLSPLGKISQQVETIPGPMKRIYDNISTLFHIDTKEISKLGVSFALSYSILSNISGAVSFSVAWYISCTLTGLSPLMPGQWKSLLKSYGMIYGFISLVRPFRVASAIAMSKLSAEYLEITQTKFKCSRKVAIGVQYSSGVFVGGCCAFLGVFGVSLFTGVPLWNYSEATPWELTQKLALRLYFNMNRMVARAVVLASP